MERDEPTPTAVEALYDSFAPPLYRYAWSLLGGCADPARATVPSQRTTAGDVTDLVAEAVHDGLVAGIVLDAERADSTDRGPWLYALVRSACQRRGFARTCPYTRLATVPAEAPVARMFSRLPASHRELVELNLRHVLPGSAIARILGLDAQLCAELSRSAIRRAADDLVDLVESNDDAKECRGAAWRTQVQQVSSALVLLRPPGPPPGLRDLVVRTCVDPDMARTRERIGAAMRPLTSDGYPLHRSRVSGLVEEPAPTPSEPQAEQLPRALPKDRVTTYDHPVLTEALTPLPGPHADPHDGTEEDGTALRRWPLPAVSGLVTVVLAITLWSWASVVGAPSTIIDTGTPDALRSPPASDIGTASTASDGKPVAEPTANASVEVGGPHEEQREDDQDTAPNEPDEHDQRNGDGHDAQDPPDPEDASPSPEPSEEPSAPLHEGDEDGDGQEGAPDDGLGDGSGLFSGLLGLLFSGG